MEEKRKQRIKPGERFGNLVATGVMKRSPSGGNGIYEVVCDCGKTIYTLGLSLKAGKKTACNSGGCKHSKKVIHGKSYSKEYCAWINMKSRCLNPKNPSYAYYGGIGVTISDEFKDSFSAFHEHLGDCLSLGLSVDRIDVTKGYERGNVRWASKRDQSLNRRKVNELTHEIYRLTKIINEAHRAQPN